jgi:hypothetical protein
LFGENGSSGIRINFANLDTSSLGAEEVCAVEALGEMLRSNALDLSLAEADCVVLDNLRVVHGRKTFAARFDGSDRWLKRAIVSRDYRRLLAWSPESSSHILGLPYISARGL